MHVHDLHQDVLTVVSVGSSIDEAIDLGIKELTEPGSPHARLNFTTFEVVTIRGTIDHPKGGTASRRSLQVEMRVYGTHKTETTKRGRGR